MAQNWTSHVKVILAADAELDAAYEAQLGELGISIDERVEEEAEWWEPEPLFRMHYQVTLEGGQQVPIFRNMKTGGWYQIEMS